MARVSVGCAIAHTLHEEWKETPLSTYNQSARKAGLTYNADIYSTTHGVRPRSPALRPLRRTQLGRHSGHRIPRGKFKAISHSRDGTANVGSDQHFGDIAVQLNPHGRGSPHETARNLLTLILEHQDNSRLPPTHPSSRRWRHTGWTCLPSCSPP